MAKPTPISRLDFVRGAKVRAIKGNWLTAKGSIGIILDCEGGWQCGVYWLTMGKRSRVGPGASWWYERTALELVERRSLKNLNIIDKIKDSDDE